MRPLSALINKNNLNKYHRYEVYPGKDVKEGDIIYMACESLKTGHIDFRCGTYKNSDRKSDYPQGYIRYWNSTLDWEVIKNDYQWTYNNAYIHYILKVYRPYPGKEGSLHYRGNEDIHIEDVEKSSDYHCIYENIKLLKKFGLR